MKKIIKYLPLYIIILSAAPIFAQKEDAATSQKNILTRRITIEPGIGLNLMPMSDLVLSNLIQWNMNKRFSVVSYTSYDHNNIFLREFNFVKTDYNYSLNQKFGFGISTYSKHSMHTFSLLAGIKYDAYQETLNNPDFEKASMSVSVFSPDAGLMYNIKRGHKKHFFSFRMYLPLYPYPIGNSDAWSLDGNMANISLEFGLGIQLK